MNQVSRVILATTLSGVFLRPAAADIAEQPQSTATAADPALEEIVVTAERRNSTVQKTAISMTAVTGQELADRGQSSLEEAIESIPGITMASGGPGQTVYQIRGVSEDGGESPTIGFYLDETPISPPSVSTNGKVAIDPDLYDLARVEVLRGPQGTLYGASSMGGTIKLVTNTPDPNNFETSGESTVSGTQSGGVNYGQNAMLNLPLAPDVAALRIVATYKNTAGWIDRVVVPNFPLETSSDPNNAFYGLVRGNVAQTPGAQVHSNVNDEELEGVRGALLVKPIDGLDVTVTGLYQRISQGGPNWIDVPPGNPVHYQPFDVAEPYSDRFEVFSLTANYEFDHLRLTSSTGYLDRNSTTMQDETEQIQNVLLLPAFSIADGGPGAASAWEYDHTHQFTEELRLASAGDGRLQWILGGYYSNYASSIDTGSAFPGVEQFTGGATDLFFRFVVPNTIEQKAVFAHVSYQYSDEFSLTTGVRYFNYTSTVGGYRGGFVFNGPDTSYIPSGDSSAGNHGINPMVTLSYTPSTDVLIYTTAAKGFRPGGANAPIPTGATAEGEACLASLQQIGRTSAPIGFGPDSLWSFELGAKTKLFDQRLILNADVYDIQWSKLQQPVALTCGLSFNDNVATAEIRGGELELTAKILNSLTFNQTVGYAHANFTSTALDANVISGQRLLDAPSLTLSSELVYTVNVGDRDIFSLRALNSYVSSSDELTYGPVKVPARDLVNMSASWKRGKYGASLFAHNVLDRHALLSYQNVLTNDLPTFNRAAENQPRTIGVSVHYEFK
jgi:iron complex outermembrane recepter protein